MEKPLKKMDLGELAALFCLRCPHAVWHEPGTAELSGFDGRWPMISCRNKACFLWEFLGTLGYRPGRYLDHAARLESLLREHAHEVRCFQRLGPLPELPGDHDWGLDASFHGIEGVRFFKEDREG